MGRLSLVIWYIEREMQNTFNIYVLNPDIHTDTPSTVIIKHIQPYIFFTKKNITMSRYAYQHLSIKIFRKIFAYGNLVREFRRGKQGASV